MSRGIPPGRDPGDGDNDDFDPFDDEADADTKAAGADESSARPSGRAGLFGETWRRAIASGANVLFNTEEGGGRGPLGDLRLPKEAIQFLLSQTDRTRRDVGRIAGKELRRLLRNVDLGGELRRTLLGIRVRLRAEVSFEEAGPKLRVRSQVVPKRPRPRRSDTSGASAAAPAKVPHDVSDAHDDDNG